MVLVKAPLLGLIGNVLIPEKGNLNSFSENFSYIGATPYIFQKTLKENLLYGNEKKISDEKLLETLRKFDVFKEEISYDLNRNVDNNSLSSGQMQKIAFIRALLKAQKVGPQPTAPRAWLYANKTFITVENNQKKI